MADVQGYEARSSSREIGIRVPFFCSLFQQGTLAQRGVKGQYWGTLEGLPRRLGPLFSSLATQNPRGVPPRSPASWNGQAATIRSNGQDARHI